jgi:hypothetical protein
MSQFLERINPGDELGSVVSSERMNALQDGLRGALTPDSLRTGPGLRLRRSGNSATVSMRRRRGGLISVPRHPWELYANGEGWSVWPATVNGTHQPTYEGESVFAVPPPVIPTDGSGNLEVWLEFDLNASSAEGIGGFFFLISGSQVLSNVVLTTASTGVTEVSVDNGTGTVTPGHYSFLVGSVVAGAKNSQPMRFSVQFTLCAGGGLSPIAYG